MQRFDRPVETTFVRYHQVRAQSLPAPDMRVLEIVGLFVLLSVFWGIILYVALTQAL